MSAFGEVRQAAFATVHATISLIHVCNQLNIITTRPFLNCLKAQRGQSLTVGLTVGVAGVGADGFHMPQGDDEKQMTKGYAFVEFNTPEVCSMLCNLSGLACHTVLTPIDPLFRNSIQA